MTRARRQPYRVQMTPKATGTATATGCRTTRRTRPATRRDSQITMVTMAGVCMTAGRKTTAVSGVVETRLRASSPGPGAPAGRAR